MAQLRAYKLSGLNYRPDFQRITGKEHTICLLTGFNASKSVGDTDGAGGIIRGTTNSSF